MKKILFWFTLLMSLVFLIRLSNGTMSRVIIENPQTNYEILENGTNKFMGLSDLYNYFQNVNIWSTFDEMITSLTNQVQTFDELNHLPNPTSFMEAVNQIGMWFSSLFSIISFPIQILWYICAWVAHLIVEIFNFFGFIGGFSQ